MCKRPTTLNLPNTASAFIHPTSMLQLLSHTLHELVKSSKAQSELVT